MKSKSRMPSLLAAALTLGLFLPACSPDAAGAKGPLPAPDWRVTVLDRRTVLVQGDFTAAEHAAYVPPGRATELGDWRWNRRFVRAARRAQARRPEIEKALTNAANWRVDGQSVSALGFWKSVTGLSRFPDTAGKTNVAFAADIVYNVFLTLATDLKEGSAHRIETPRGSTLDFTRDPNVPSPFFKVNQVGYLPDAAKKYAYLGGWLGTGGAWKPPAEARTFEVVDVRTGKRALAGMLTETNAEGLTPDGTPWYGEEPLEADISALTQPGTYYLRVPGVGRSRDFRVGGDGAREAFAVSMHGLFVQRCGSSDKHEPYTHWGDRPCHLKVIRGAFPPDLADYGKAKARTDYGFFTADGTPVDQSHFHIIALNAPKDGEVISVPGGWHDAADYDRRPMHIGIVNLFAGVYLLKPANFRDGDLNLPESGNGIPDILDEAAWGLEHLRAAQQPDGGVGTWIESTGHPVEGMGMPSENSSNYYLSRATRASTLSYCAAAALLARLDPKLRERFLDSAVRAWNYVHTAKPAEKVPFKGKNKAGEVIDLYWTESKELPPQDELKAAINLSMASRDIAYLKRTLTPAFAQSFTNAWRTSGLGWGPLHLVELCNETLPALTPYRDLVTNLIRRGAGKHRAIFSENTAYRTTWYAPRFRPRPNSMPWGGCHPLPKAPWFIAAFAFTGEESYLTDVALSFDFHCGCNPDGMTLTSGLGTVYPISMLHLQSSADGIAECAAGITPYRWTGRPYTRDTLGLVRTEEEERLWPVWRWRPNLETLHVASGEFTVWETIAPAAAVAGYLMPPAAGSKPIALRKPVAQLNELPGYWAIP